MEIRTFKLINNVGDEVNIANYGARITQWFTTVNGEIRNIVLGYTDLTEYLNDPNYLGAIAGPYANRIKGAQVEIDDEIVQLQANEGKNQLHGGKNALANLFWKTLEQTSNSVTLMCELADGYNGYPGAVVFKVNYQLTENSQLIIDINATTEKTTVIGPTSHPYFNLAGAENSSKGHQLKLLSEHYTPVDAESIPTGELASVAGTPFDFRQTKTLIDTPENSKFDHNFVLLPSQGEAQAVLTSPDKKLQLHVTSNYPGIQLYTGEYLGGEFTSFQGICLEPQFYPNSPNCEAFPFYLTTPDEPFSVQICYGLVKA